ncbi:hypothetical protein JXO52_06575 [bacterium]|nr:hypothetical protein [bacterium]
MEIIDLSEAYYPQYLCCLEDWSDDIKEGGDGKRLWFETMREKGLRVKLAVIDGSAVSTGPPPSYEKIRKKIAGRLRRIGRSKDAADRRAHE